VAHVDHTVAEPSMVQQLEVETNASGSAGLPPPTIGDRGGDASARVAAHRVFRSVAAGIAEDDDCNVVSVCV
jgi:hypothetical protein